MIHSYDDDEVVSTQEIEKHKRTCFANTFINKVRGHCSCKPIHGTRIVIEKWDEYSVKPKESK